MAGREVLLGVTGGVAAYKAADLCSKLVQQQYHVTVILTRAAEQFIGKTTFEALTNRPVYTDLFQPQEHFRGEHIGLAQRAEVVVIAPATADSMAQLAHGFAPDLLATSVLVATCPVILAPAMNADMWAQPAVQRNVQQLLDDGRIIVPPGEGWLSCGQTGPGRMAEPVEILAAIASALSSRTARSDDSASS
jgi:phosphopantothenoylcysteine decarboxylase